MSLSRSPCEKTVFPHLNPPCTSCIMPGGVSGVFQPRRTDGAMEGSSRSAVEGGWMAEGSVPQQVRLVSVKAERPNHPSRGGGGPTRQLR